MVDAGSALNQNDEHRKCKSRCQAFSITHVTHFKCQNTIYLHPEYTDDNERTNTLNCASGLNKDLFIHKNT